LTATRAGGSVDHPQKEHQMIRRVALIVSFAVASFVPTLAQTQTQTHPPHPQGKPHDPADHKPMDPALHAALHARLHGTWTGMVTSSDGIASKLQMAIATDKQGKTTVKMTTDRSMKTGSATDVALDAQGLHWTQPISGASCKATAVLEAAAHHGPDAMKGTLVCGHGEIPFALQKTKG
jgi:hypothetical protein